MEPYARTFGGFAARALGCQGVCRGVSTRNLTLEKGHLPLARSAVSTASK